MIYLLSIYDFIGLRLQMVYEIEGFTIVTKEESGSFIKEFSGIKKFDGDDIVIADRSSVPASFGCAQCTCDLCLYDEISIMEVYGKRIALYVGIMAMISFLITLGFSLVYKYNKEENPWKHAIKRSWIRWILISLLPLIVIGVMFLITEENW